MFRQPKLAKVDYTVSPVKFKFLLDIKNDGAVLACYGRENHKTKIFKILSKKSMRSVSFVQAGLG
jgi:hypothetical protein